MIVCVNEIDIILRIEESESKSPSLKRKAVIGGDREGWINFTTGLNKSSEVFKHPVKKESPNNNDIMLLYFTSGTTGMPKMVNHNFIYPLGHILTAKYLAECEG